MEKTLEFGGKNVTFKSNMKTLLIYKAQTGREYLSDVVNLGEIVKYDDKGNVLKGECNLAALNTELLCTVAWAMARTADKNVPELYDWLDEFDEFPIMTVLNELMPMITKSIKADKKNA